jgi:5,10-methylenetetrahydromethanopterin reductase
VTTFGINLGVSAREPIRRVAEVARAAEGWGLDVVWILDSQLAMKDVYVALTLAALETRRIRVGTGVTNPVTRHLTHTVNAIAAVDEVSAGRAILGVGAGDSAVFPLGAKPASIRAMRSALGNARDLLAGREIALEGWPVRVASATQPVPVFVAASQPRMLMLAGELADGVIILGAADRELTEWQLAWVERGARSVGRDLTSIFVDLWLAISIADDERKALGDVRAVAASQARWFYRWKEIPPPLERFRDEFARADARYEFSSHLSRRAPHGDAVSDEFAAFVALAGPAERCAERVRELLRAKVDRVSFTLLSGDRIGRLRQLGSELLPRLAR